MVNSKYSSQNNCSQFRSSDKCRVKEKSSESIFRNNEKSASPSESKIIRSNRAKLVSEKLRTRRENHRASRFENLADEPLKTAHFGLAKTARKPERRTVIEAEFKVGDCPPTNLSFALQSNRENSCGEAVTHQIIQSAFPENFGQYKANFVRETTESETVSEDGEVSLILAAKLAGEECKKSHAAN